MWTWTGRSWVAEFERRLATRFVRLPREVLRRLVGPPLRSPEGYAMDLESQALLWLVRVRRTREMCDRDLGVARTRFDRAASTLEPRRPPGLAVTDRLLPGGVGPVACRVYRPQLPAGAPSAARHAPAMVWMHGGGFVLGSLGSHDGVCRALASEAGIVVVSVAYRLAPEHRFPAGLDDAVAVTRWVLANGASLGIAIDRVAVGGDSAGGNLAAGVAQATRGDARRPVFQLLVYPATDATLREPSHRHFRSGFILTEDSIRWFLHNYIGDPKLALDERVSPVLAHDVSGLPPALVLTAGFDPLRDEGLLYAQRMREADADVESICAEGALHGFLNTAGALDTSARHLRIAAARLARRLGADYPHDRACARSAPPPTGSVSS